MSARDAKKLAEEYLREQAKIMQKHGSAPKLHGERYRESVIDTQRQILTLKRHAEGQHIPVKA
jgi:hypothetical protein